MSGEAGVSILVGTAAAIDDLARRQISNWICLAALIGGLCLQVISQGLRGLLFGATGVLTGFSVFLIFYLLGGMGGGDIKLMAGFGAVLGAGKVAEAALWTAACGGVLAVLWIAASWIRKSCTGLRSKTDAPPVCIPYAPAIVVGVWLSLIPKT